jgi:hypothetical protein
MTDYAALPCQVCQFFYGLSGFRTPDLEPQYITDFYFYIGIASLSMDFQQPGCPGAPSMDFIPTFNRQMELVLATGLPILVNHHFPPHRIDPCSLFISFIHFIYLHTISLLRSLCPFSFTSHVSSTTFAREKLGGRVGVLCMVSRL